MTARAERAEDAAEQDRERPGIDDHRSGRTVDSTRRTNDAESAVDRAMQAQQQQQ